MSKLPNAERAVVPIKKLREYSLNPFHTSGKHKARVFRSALGFTPDNASQLREMIRAAVLTNDAQKGETDEHGERYTVDFKVMGIHHVVSIRTAWIIDAGETVPRLVSCYIVE